VEIWCQLNMYSNVSATTRYIAYENKPCTQSVTMMVSWPPISTKK